MDAGRELAHAADVLAAGGVVVYPTETLYALGCRSDDADAAARLAAAKARPSAKPLPLVAADRRQVDDILDHTPPDMDRLARAFWPGPLSILVPSRLGVCPQARDPLGLTSVRITSHRLAARLCAMVGAPLVATSANASGKVPAARPAELDPALLERVDAAVLCPPLPAGGDPSTVVRPLGGLRLEVLRHGAVPAAALKSAGFTLVRPRHPLP